MDCSIIQSIPLTSPDSVLFRLGKAEPVISGPWEVLVSRHFWGSIEALGANAEQSLWLLAITCTYKTEYRKNTCRYL